MHKICVAAYAIVSLSVSLFGPWLWAEVAHESESEALYHKYLEFPKYVIGGKVEPHWMADGNSFWYAEGAPENTVIWKVDPVANTKESLFDVQRLRSAVKAELGHDPPYDGVPFTEFSFLDEGESTIRFALEDRQFELRLDNYHIREVPQQSDADRRRETAQIIRQAYYDYPDLYEVPSPDARWFVGLKDHNLYLRSPLDDGIVQLTTRGLKNYSWGDLPWSFGPIWSPSSLKLAVTRKDYRRVPHIPIVHYLNPDEQVVWEPYPWKATGPIEVSELFLIDIPSKQPIKVATEDGPSERIEMLGWSPDESEFFFLKRDRYYRKRRLFAADSKTGETREILLEEYEAAQPFLSPATLLESGEGLIWLADRDGWKHLYLYDLKGNLLRRLTEGEFPVERVVTVDEKNGWVYFIARTDRTRPYDTHLCRIDLNGENFKQLTEATGQHDLRLFGGWQIVTQIQFSPSKRFFIDTHSTVERPQAVDLRSADGSLLQRLAEANTDRLSELNWTPPEEFVVKAADGKTDLYGILYKPNDLDPSKKYPVIGQIYGQLNLVPSTFLGRPYAQNDHAVGQALAQLGFIVFNVAQRPDNGSRGRDFDKLLWNSYGRFEIPDHAAALHNLAQSRPYMDLDRVGIYGGSQGGYFALRAMLQAPETYHVGVAVAPLVEVYTHANHNNLGPVEENRDAYEFASNIRLAGNLKGKLLLIHGTADVSISSSHTMKMADALIRAEKPFDLLVIPEWGHWYNERVERYWVEVLRRYFVEHLKPQGG
jgi:dipeptidyl aminopeptidase/acylaminoacyl peptidase